MFIARAGKGIGKYPREEIANLLQGGAILESDHYWYSGMEEWGQISDLLAARRLLRYGEPTAPGVSAARGPGRETPPPPPSPPKNWLLRGALLLAGVIGITALGTWLIRPDWADEASPGSVSLSGSALSQRLTDAEVRNEAAADMQQSLEGLPKYAVPPSTTFYIDVSATMYRNPSLRAPLKAVIVGSENTINLETEETVLRTAFTVRAEYLDGVWTYTSYHAKVTDMHSLATTELKHDPQAPTPPAVISLLRLKIPRSAETSIAM